ncbi:Uu.00g061230.m01.CDS01 [Anthostomella pinea]|uniref:Protein-S-isoprenylcysteine O-methyltransferase n=1 Tax=Anthostomella pinea TaxID=933095 RepID=A0AAI8VSG7_9PEZI|nr:Uu.00g061230.m01.CDS01 [Anthostomella pinea]
MESYKQRSDSLRHLDDIGSFYGNKIPTVEAFAEIMETSAFVAWARSAPRDSSLIEPLDAFARRKQLVPTTTNVAPGAREQNVNWPLRRRSRFGREFLVRPEALDGSLNELLLGYKARARTAGKQNLVLVVYEYAAEWTIVAFTLRRALDSAIKEHREYEAPSWATRSNNTFHRRSLAQLASITTRASDESADELLPLLSPVAQSAQMTPDRPYTPGQPKSLEGIAVRSFCLGITLALSVVTMITILVFTSSPLWRVPFFFGALSTFHFLEFWTTAKYNTPIANVDSFLLTANWPAYAIAHVSASVECLLSNLLFPNRSWAPFYLGHILLLIGFLMVFVGQVARSAAMVQAGQSFNHTVQSRKKDNHELVTTGLYSFVRHPSYFGFFYWGIGTQLILGNPICFVAYTAVLWKFFSNRTKHEEHYLIEFFDEDYIQYKKRVGTGMPFIWGSAKTQTTGRPTIKDKTPSDASLIKNGDLKSVKRT